MIRFLHTHQEDNKERAKRICLQVVFTFVGLQSQLLLFNMLIILFFLFSNRVIGNLSRIT